VILDQPEHRAPLDALMRRTVNSGFRVAAGLVTTRQILATAEFPTSRSHTPLAAAIRLDAQKRE
jgi:hypothetical protein